MLGGNDSTGFAGIHHPVWHLAKGQGFPTLRPMRYLRHPGAVLIFFSLVVHASVLLAVFRARGQIDAMAFNSLDCGEFYRLAVNLARYGAFSQEDRSLRPTGTGRAGASEHHDGDRENGPLTPDTWRTPGYPLFLATAMSLAGESPAGLIVVQQLLSVLSVWLLFQIARNVMTPTRAAVVAALFLFSPHRLHYSLWLLSTTLFTTVLLLVWLAWRRATEGFRPVASLGSPQVKSDCALSYADPREPNDGRNSERNSAGNSAARGPRLWAALAGALTGLAILTRPIAVLLPVLLLAGLCAVGLRSRSRKGHAFPWWHSPTAFVLACLLPIGAWMGRNYMVAEHFALSSQGGAVLAYFKAAEVVLWREGTTANRYIETSMNPAKEQLPHRVWNGIDERLRERFSSLDDAIRSSLSWRNLAQGNKTSVDSFEISSALADIGWSYLMAGPLSTATCCLARCGSILTFPLNLALQPAAGMPARRLRSLALAAPYLLLCLAVVIRLLRRGMHFEEVYFPLACVAALLLATTPQTDPRFRVPMIPMLLFVAFLPKRASRPQELSDWPSGDSAA